MGQNANSLFAARGPSVGGAGRPQAQLSVDAFGALTSVVGAAAAAGGLFFGANQTGAALSAALATTYTGLVLSNPAASGKNLVLMRASGSLNVAPAALTAIGLIAGFAAGGITAHTTPITAILSAKLGSALPASVAKIDAAATLVGTPAWADWLSETPGATSVLTFSRLYDGGVVIPPGGYVAIGASIAGPAAGLLASFSWSEVAV